MQLKSQFLFLFFLLVGIVALLLYFEKEYRIGQFLQKNSQSNQAAYHTVYGKYHEISKLVYELIIDTQETKEIYTGINDLTKQQLGQRRTQLHTKLQKAYSRLKTHSVRQVHFHLKDSSSFLRLHNRELYGDDLSKVRESVVFVNKHQKPFHGFEEGKLYNGLRFVYPLFDTKGEHAGSVEISFSTLALSKEFIKNFNKTAQFFLDKNVVSDKVLQPYRKNYVQSPLERFCMEESAAKAVFEKAGIETMFALAPSQEAYFDKKLQEKEIFSFYNTKMQAVTTVIPVTNQLANKVTGFFTVTGSGQYVINKTLNFYFILISGSITLATILFFLYKDMKSRKKIQKDSTVLNTLFQEVDSGIGLVDTRGRFLKVNQKFASILGYNPTKLLLGGPGDFMEENDRKRFSKALEITRKRQVLSKMSVVFHTSSRVKIHFELSLRYLADHERFIVVINKTQERFQLQELNEILDTQLKQQGKQLRIQDKVLLKQNRLAFMGQALGLVKDRWDILFALLPRQVQLPDKSKKELEAMHAMLHDIDEFFDHEDSVAPFSAKDAVQNTLLKHAAYLDLHNITFAVEGEDFMIKGSKAEFLQAMMHLIENAKDAIVSRKVQEGLITIVFQEYKILVKDNGKGISQDMLPVIFRPFTTTKDKGSGIGLYLTRQLLHNMGVRIDARNAAMGAVFTLSFPDPQS